MTILQKLERDYADALRVIDRANCPTMREAAQSKAQAIWFKLVSLRTSGDASARGHSDLHDW